MRKAALVSRPDLPRAAAFPRSARLTRAADFSRVFAQGRRYRTRHFTFVYAPAPGSPRLGLAVGRRASPRAVVRNRIKRIARESFRHSHLSAFDVVVIARPGLEGVSRETLRGEFDATFRGLK